VRSPFYEDNYLSGRGNYIDRADFAEDITVDYQSLRQGEFWRSGQRCSLMGNRLVVSK